MNIKKINLLVIPLALVLIFDQVTKIWAKNFLIINGNKIFLGGLFRLIYAENRGAWGSLGSSFSPEWRFILLIIVPILALLGFAWFVISNRKMKDIETLSYSLILGGGFGNLIDRIRYDYVVDFMYIGYQNIGTNIFNVADVSIMIGVGFLAIQSVKEALAKRSGSA
ncbi:MAG: signal peptidase II [Bacteriovoracaceae bacterium]|nr:signal peptidase II [Bacteriovoracaceae bacterium]